MKARCATNIRSDAGFTILELIVALTILAIAYMLAVPRVDLWSDRRQVDDAFDRLRIELARRGTDALRSGKAASFDPGVLSSENDVVISVEPPGPVVIYPDGSATPKRITVRYKDYRRVFKIDWLTGNVAEERT